MYIYIYEENSEKFTLSIFFSKIGFLAHYLAGLQVIQMNKSKWEECALSMKYNRITVRYVGEKRVLSAGYNGIMCFVRCFPLATYTRR